MKKNLIFVFALFLLAGSITSCSKRCKGGGWYGNRNLGYAPMKKKNHVEKEAVATACELIKEEDCEITAD